MTVPRRKKDPYIVEEDEFIRPGTTVEVVVIPDDAATFTLTSSALTGTLQSSTATAGPITVPSGHARIQLRASWTQ